MPLRTFTLTKKPGDAGFIDEFNSAALELSAAANKIVRCDFIVLDVGSSTQTVSMAHGLGVVPDFIWSMDTGTTRSAVRLTVSAAEKASWSATRVRFTPVALSTTLTICVMALK